MSLLKKHSLTRLIFLRSAVTILAVTLASIAVTLSFLYNAYLEESRESLADKAGYIASGVEMGGESYLSTLNPHRDIRITWIAPDGTVLFDTQADPSLMDNHLSRPEVLEAMQTGSGQSSRVSVTLSGWTVYHALRISDGSVVRLCLLETSPMDILARAAVPIGVMVAVLLVLSVALAAATSKKIVAPINRIDLKSPQSDSVYTELIPLTQRIQTQNAQIQEAMRRQEEEHEARDRFRREFTANVSHELKTPLTSISGFAEIIRDGLVRPEDISHFAGNIYNEAQRLILLVGDIIKISRIEDGRLPTQREDVELFELSRIILDRLRPAAEKMDVTLHLEGAHACIHGDYQIVDEMIYNLCDNAIKYNRPGGHVYVSIESLDAGTRLTVRDTGIGIEPEHRERVFERFYRVDKTRSKQIGGTGLGLSIVKHGAIYHQAELKMESTPGEGTTIWVTFPK